MIFLDLQQTAIANLMMGLSKGHHDVVINGDILRHMVFNSIRLINTKFKSEYGDLVIACEGREVWRREIFPYYKANRKKSRDASDVDWGLVFSTLDEIKSELMEFFPYSTIKCDTAEADDIIGHLVKKTASSDTKTLIVSGDKDFIQLHKYPNVKQWNGVKKELVFGDPITSLKSKIIRGDTGDGVPNILSDDDTLVNPDKRQKPITTVKESKWLSMEPHEICETDTMRRNWSRNETLIDLSRVPTYLKAEIDNKYTESLEKRSRKGLYEYFLKRGLNQMASNVQDF